MPRWLMLLIPLIVLPWAMVARAGHPAFAPGELLVLAADDSPLFLDRGGHASAADSRVAAILGRHGLVRARVLGRGPETPDRSASRFLALTSARGDFDPMAAAAELRTTGIFRAVVPNLHLRLHATFPDDIYLPYQWSVDTPTGAHIHLPDAWDIEQGSPSVVIGIMDTGVDTGHPDLASQIWNNAGEIPANGLDDDVNGYVDDVRGWDFGNGDNDPNPHAVIDTTGLDSGFHGTFVAAIASASTNNGDGIAGAGWNCRIMPLKVVDSAGDITLAAVTAAFDYAGRMGAKVLNMSFGAPGDPGVAEYFQALVDVATDAGVVCVASAGNDNSDAPIYPAACANVLSVGATNESELRADFSNWGDWVDVAAPGDGMWSAICSNYEVNLVNQVFYIFFFGWDGVNPYMYGSGTSFACPLVAGVCGLVRAHYPSWPPQVVIQHVTATGDTVPYDQPIGLKVNAYRAVNDAVTAVPRLAARPLEFGYAFPNPFLSSTMLGFTLASGGRVRLSIYDCAGRRVRDLLDENLGAGPHTLRWDGGGADGVRLESGVYFARIETRDRSATRRVALMR